MLKVLCFVVAFAAYAGGADAKTCLEWNQPGTPGLIGQDTASLLRVQNLGTQVLTYDMTRYTQERALTDAARFIQTWCGTPMVIRSFQGEVVRNSRGQLIGWRQKEGVSIWRP